MLDVEEEREGEAMEETRKRGEKGGKGEVKVKVGGKWKRYKLGVVVYSSEEDEEKKEVFEVDCGQAKEQQAAIWNGERRKED